MFVINNLLLLRNVASWRWMEREKGQFGAVRDQKKSFFFKIAKKTHLGGLALSGMAIPRHTDGERTGSAMTAGEPVSHPGASPPHTISARQKMYGN